jgi:hypothetical protein
MHGVSRIRPRILVIFVLSSLLLTPVKAGASSNSLNPISISFPSPHVGYVLSLYDCAANTCAALRGTTNDGATWSVVAVPRQLNSGLQLVSWGTYDTGYATLTIHFADALNGWVYGTVPAPVTPNTSNPNWQGRLWSTHDGGRTWQQVRLGPLAVSAGVIQMATHGVWTYLFGGSEQTGRARILATRSTTDHWTGKSTTPMWMPAGGSPLEGSFTFARSKGWFVDGNDRGISPSAQLSSDGSWRAWSTPSPAFLGASFAPIVAVTDKVLLAQCAFAGFVTPPASSIPAGWYNGASWLFISYDAGATFKPLRQLAGSSQVGYENVPGLPAIPVPGTILLEQYTNSGHRLVQSSNWGRSWRVVLNHAILQAQFVSRSSGFAIADENTSQTSQLKTSLLRTNDTGSHWTVIHL